MKVSVRNNGWTPKISKQEQRKINRVVLAEIGEYWHDHFRAKHFTREGAAEYNYAPRSKGYMIRKAKVKGHQDPLVYSGMSRALAAIKDVRPFSPSADRAYVHVVIHAPTLNLIPTGGTINLREEMERVSQGELAVLSGVLARAKQREEDALRDTSTKVLTS